MKKFIFLAMTMLGLGISGSSYAQSAPADPVTSTNETVYEYTMTAMSGAYASLKSNLANCVGFSSGDKVKIKLVDSGDGTTFHLVPTNKDGFTGPVGCDGTTNGTFIFFTEEGSPKTYDNWVVEKAANGYYHIKLQDNTNVAFTAFSSTKMGLFNYTGTPNNQAYQWHFYPANDNAIVAALDWDTYLPSVKEAADKVGIGYPKADASERNALKTAITNVENDASVANKQALIEAYNTFIAVTDVQMPEVGKFYKISSAFTNFGSTKDMFSALINGAQDFRWGAEDASKNSHYWTLVNVDGATKMMNANGYYVKSSGRTGNQNGDDMFTMTADKSEATTVTFTALGEGQFNITFAGSNPAHTNGHAQGNGTAGSIIAWEGGKNNASSWNMSEISGYDLYTVEITAPEGASPVATRTATSETALNGAYFVNATGITPTNTEFAADIDGYDANIVVDADNKKITVTYTLNKAAYAIQLNDACVAAAAVFGLRGPGYPLATSSAYATIADLTSELVAKCSTPELLDLTEMATLEAALNTYKATTTDIEKPVSGVAYVIKHLKYDGTYQYMTSVNGALKTNATTADNASTFIYMENTDGKGVFVNAATGKYLIYRGYSDLFQANNGAITLTSANNANAGQGQLEKKPDFGTVRLDVAGRNASGAKASSLIFTTAGDPDNCNQVFYLKSGFSNIFKIEKASDNGNTYPYNTVNLKTAGSEAYASLFLPFAVTLPEGITAYTGTVNGSSLTMTAVEGNVVPAATSVILKGTADEETLLPALVTETSTVAKGDLQGTIEEVVNPGNTYALSGANGTIGFYPYTASNLPRGKAYLTLTSGAQGLTMSFDGEATGIEGIENDTNGNKACYDLSGRRVLNPTKGLYIIGGKKVYVK